MAGSDTFKLPTDEGKVNEKRGEMALQEGRREEGKTGKGKRGSGDRTVWSPLPLFRPSSCPHSYFEPGMLSIWPPIGPLETGVMLVAGARPSSAGAAGGGGNVGACVPVVLAGPGGVSGAPLGTIEVCGPPSSDGPSGWAS